MFEWKLRDVTNLKNWGIGKWFGIIVNKVSLQFISQQTAVMLPPRHVKYLLRGNQNLRMLCLNGTGKHNICQQTNTLRTTADL